MHASFAGGYPRSHFHDPKSQAETLFLIWDPGREKLKMKSVIQATVLNYSLNPKLPCYEAVKV